MKKVFLFFALVFLHVDMAWAGPGGRIAKEIFDTTWGKIGFGLIVLIFFPLLLEDYLTRRKAIKRAKNSLNKLARIDHSIFDEFNLKNRVTDVFNRVHKAWSSQDLTDCEEYMTYWYRQNQQSVFLDEWKEKGLMNISSIKKINKIEPIHVRLSDRDDFERSRIIYLINAKMEDYLVKIENSSVIEGKKGFRNIETAWTFQYINGKWCVDNIEHEDMVSEYMSMKDDYTVERLELLAKVRGGV